MTGAARMQRAIEQVAERTGFPVKTFYIIAWAADDSRGRRSPGPEAVSAEAVCAGCLQSLSRRFYQPLEEVLESLQIRSSEDLGIVLFELQELGFVELSGFDGLRDFGGCFVLENLQPFLDAHHVARNRTRRRCACVSLGLCGAVLLLLVAVALTPDWRSAGIPLVVLATISLLVLVAYQQRYF